MKLPQEFSSATSDRKMKQARSARRSNGLPPKSKRRSFERKKPHDDYSEWRRELL